MKTPDRYVLLRLFIGGSTAESSNYNRHFLARETFGVVGDRGRVKLVVYIDSIDATAKSINKMAVNRVNETVNPSSVNALVAQLSKVTTIEAKKQFNPRSVDASSNFAERNRAIAEISEYHRVRPLLLISMMQEDYMTMMDTVGRRSQEFTFDIERMNSPRNETLIREMPRAQTAMRICDGKLYT